MVSRKRNSQTIYEANRYYAQGDFKSSDWTLRFKNHDVTILLIVSPAKPFGSIKETLLNALKIRNIKEINGKSVPEDPSEIEFGVPIDRNNLHKGWQKMENADKRPSTGGTKSVLNTSPQGAGLRDSQAVAFRFRNATESDKEQDEEVAAMDLDDPGWDVKIPKYDDDEDED